MSDTVSKEILLIRSKAGNQNEICPTCGRAPGNPYRLYDERGKVFQGCIDAIHTGQLPRISESNFWQNRDVARKMRRDQLKHLKSIKK